MVQSIIMAALKDGLQKNDLLFFLEKKYPQDFTDMLARAEGYARAQEAFKLKNEEAIRKWRVSESSKPAAVEKSSEAQPHSKTPPEHKQA